VSVGTKNLTIDVVTYGLLAGVVGFVWSAGQALTMVSGDIFPQTSLSISRTQSVVAQVEDNAVALQLMAMEEKTADLNQVITEFANNEPNSYGILVQHLTEDIQAEHRADETIIAASLYKPFAAVAALRMVEAGTLRFDETLSGTEGRSVETCIRDTIVVSDNPCGRALLSRTGLRTPGGMKQLRDDGYANTDLRGDYPKTTARDVALLFAKLYQGELLSPKMTEQLLNILKAQTINERIPAQLPDEITVAHKTGDLEGVAHDAGIVYGQNGPYVIVMMSGPDSTRGLDERYEQMAQLSKDVFEVLETNY
jgi:beta-lactamase class A